MDVDTFSPLSIACACLDSASAAAIASCLSQATGMPKAIWSRCSIAGMKLIWCWRSKSELDGAIFWKTLPPTSQTLGVAMCSSQQNDQITYRPFW